MVDEIEDAGARLPDGQVGVGVVDCCVRWLIHSIARCRSVHCLTWDFAVWVHVGEVGFAMGLVQGCVMADIWQTEFFEDNDNLGLQ